MTAGTDVDSHREIRRGHAALAATQLCFGFLPLFGTLAFADGGFAPAAVACWRMVFGAVVLGAIAFWRHGTRAWPGVRELPILFLLSLLGVTCNQLLYLNGLERSTVSNAGLLMCLIPVFTFVIAALFRQERFRPMRALGVTISLGGALFWWSQERSELVDEYAFGNLLIAINTVSYAAYMVISRPVVRRIPPLVAIAWIFILSALTAPLVAIGTDLWPEDAPRQVWLSLLYVLVFATVISYLLNIYALRRLRSSTAAIYIYAQPLIAASAGALILGEELTPVFLGAAALIFTGIWLVSRCPPTPSSPG
jgi:drug/metabolite transporter (DMT)-like permease